MSKCFREYVLDLIDEGLLDSHDMVLMFVSWNTSDDIKEMLRANDIELDII
tara:strand:+ start:394 stop:546 length:153 start_codon:yes stop_codon:yes gene_type:complete